MQQSMLPDRSAKPFLSVSHMRSREAFLGHIIYVRIYAQGTRVPCHLATTFVELERY